MVVDSFAAKDFRKAWLAAHEKAVTGGTDKTQTEDDVAERDFVRAIRCGVSDTFSDGINSGFYINSYTTKPGPGLAGMLEELRKGGTKMMQVRIEFGFGCSSVFFARFLLVSRCCVFVE